MTPSRREDIGRPLNQNVQNVENVAGVQLPVFEVLDESGEGELVGMAKGGQRISQ